MNMRTLKRFATICVAAAMCMAFAVPQAWADESSAKATIGLAPVENQNAVEVTIQAGNPESDAASTLPDVTTLSLALEIEITGGDPSEVSESFTFSDQVNAMNPTVAKYSIPPVQSKANSNVVRMNVYISGVKDALSSKSLDVGRVNLSVKEGSTAQATVLVPDVANALSFVDNSYEQEDIPKANLFVPETPTVQLGAVANPPAAGNGNGDGNVGDNADNGDIVGQNADTNPNKGLAKTGDTLMPVIIGLVCVAVAAVVVIVVVAIRKRKGSGNSGAPKGDAEDK